MKRYLPSVFFLILIISCKQEERRDGSLALPDKVLIDKIPFDIPEERFSLNLNADLQPLLPPAEDQVKQGSCTSFAVAYGLVSYYEKRRSGYSYEVNNGHAKTDRIFSPSFVYNAIKNKSSDCTSGIDFVEAFSFINTNGVCRWIDFPYNSNLQSCSRPPTQDIFNKAKRFNGYKFYRIAENTETLKKYLSQGLPIIIGIYTSENMDLEGYKSPKDKPYIWSPKESDLSLYHALLCVGYDDKYGFKLFNSWGPKWGVDGYCYIPYLKLFNRAREFYIAKIDRPSNFFSNEKISDKEFESLITTIPDSTSTIEEYNQNRKQIDSLFKADYNRIKKLKIVTPNQKRLMSQLEKFIGN